MLSSLVLLVHLFALGATATRDLWLPGLPGCWQSCIGSTEDGCRSSGCICTTSAFSTTYLPSAVSCAVSQCHADEWSLYVVLGSLELYCDAINWPISDDVLAKAYAAAGNPGLQSISLAKPSSTTKPPAPKTTKGSSDAPVTSTYRTTLTQTTLDSNGNTVQIIVPIVLGPTGYSTGSIITSTVHKATSTTAAPSPAATSLISTTPSSTTPTRASSTSSTGSSQTQRPANGNGSPFENMQAEASQRWSMSRLLQGLGALAVLFMRLQ